MDQDQLFLEQYNQVWEQRRHHVKLYWAIPATAAVLILVLQQIDFGALNVWTIHTSFMLLLVFSFSCVMLFLRHNFIQHCYGLLLSDLDKTHKPLKKLPHFGEDLRQRYRKKKFNCWENLGSRWNGIWSWLLICFSVGLFFALIWLDMTGLPTQIRVFVHEMTR